MTRDKRTPQVLDQDECGGKQGVNLLDTCRRGNVGSSRAAPRTHYIRTLHLLNRHIILRIRRHVACQTIGRRRAPDITKLSGRNWA
jgi:hypothetical protein